MAKERKLRWAIQTDAEGNKVGEMIMDRAKLEEIFQGAQWTDYSKQAAPGLICRFKRKSSTGDWEHYEAYIDDTWEDEVKE